MKIIRFPLGQMQANCYFVINGNNCLIVDPADDAPFILEEIQRRKLNLLGLLATHGHFDHLMAVGEIQLSYNIPLYIFKGDQFLIDRLEETSEYFLGYKTNIIKPLNIKFFKEGPFLEKTFGMKVIKTPGHTPGGCVFYLEKENTLICGDLLFKGAIGRYDFAYCNKKHLKESLAKILKLPKVTKVLPGHGEETIIENEQLATTLII
ncbi:MAG: YqgX [Candidatus Roizmanbacteria bacterium GW2011_GWA2_35_19]|uniref:YqgX n=2 Tax=Candidatus Roizmaniibacteriota TaxID=1752723 RepID=A0A0G0EEX4_9BACT|nr:MAG: YqgX [Candidatus Roizmanbacteria bacterium GW2011_GWC2_35_12]KKP73740.1 MAG: YqgX [Candidatus Roizmanbacteria bacterium GW2011_GWA2_35_19]